MMQDRIPPQNPKAEEAVLGSIIIGGVPTLIEALEILEARDFYFDENRKLWAALVKMHEEDLPIDSIALHERFPQIDIVKASSLQSAVPTAANIKYYADIVKNKSIARQGIRLCHGELEKLYTDDKPSEVISQSVLDQSRLLSGTQKQDVLHIREVSRQVFNRFEERLDKSKSLYVSTGYLDLDRKLHGGLRKSGLHFLAARPKMGKTTFALNVCKNITLIQGKKGVFVSLEMSSEDLAQKMIAEEAGIESNIMDNIEYLKDSDWPRLSRSLGKVSEANLYLYDPSSIKASSLEIKLKAFVARHPDLEVVFIDYLQLMESEKGRFDSANAEITASLKILKRLSRELNIPIFILSQLSRAVEQRSDHVPMLSDLRDSGSIEQDATSVMFLYREDYYQPKDDPNEDPSVTKCIIAANRFGPVGISDFMYFKAQSRFTQTENHRQPPQSGPQREIHP